MATALLDTNAVSDLMTQHAGLTARINALPHRVSTCTTVVGEIRFGVDRLPDGKKKTDIAARMNDILQSLQIEPISVDIAVAYGQLKASTRAIGLNIKDNDLWIASSAIALGLIFVTRDKLLARIPGLVVEDWWA